VDLTKHAFFEGKIVPLSEAKISIATHGFLYGTAVFGGMRAYWNEEKQTSLRFSSLRPFPPFVEFGRMMAMSIPYDEEGLINSRSIFETGQLEAGCVPAPHHLQGGYGHRRAPA
jgi:hypothetical protein